MKNKYLRVNQNWVWAKIETTTLRSWSTCSTKYDIWWILMIKLCLIIEWFKFGMTSEFRTKIVRISNDPMTKTTIFASEQGWVKPEKF